MSHRFDPTGSFDPLDGIIADYLQSLEAGRTPSREEVLGRHPALADRLRIFFADFDAVGRDASKFHLPQSDRHAETMTDGGSKKLELPRIQYLGDYELLDEIARGGMGVVYRARQVSLNRPVAIKMILAGTYATPDAVQRFRAEAEAAANLDHPNILPIYEVGEHEGHQYFSMKLVEGGSLSIQVEKLKTQPNDAALLMTTLARAVHFAHQRGILHRDLKPANVLLDRDGTPFITDFGLAKKVDADDGSTRTGSIVGTPSYMAPEQARGEKGLTTSVDVYSLGAILYELLTGQPPFKGATIFDTVKQVIEVEPTDPRSINASANRDLSVIALKCLNKDPGRRYVSAADLGDDLDRWLNGQPIAARPISTWEQGWMWVRRNPTVAALSFGIAAALIIGVIVSAHFAAEADARRIDAEANAQAAHAQTEEAERQRVLTGEAAKLAQQEATRAELAREQAEQALSANRLALAQQYWRADDPDQAFRLLDEIPEPRRGWEWFYLNRLRKPELLALPANGQFTHWLAASQDGTRLATFADSGIEGCDVWDLITNKKVTEIRAPLIVGTMTPDGQSIILARRDGTVAIYNAATGKEAKVIAKIVTRVTSLDVSGDGKRVLIGGAQAKQFDLETGAEVPLPAAVESAIGFAPGQRLMGYQRKASTANWFGLMDSGRPELTLFEGSTGRVEQILSGASSWAFTPDGKTMAVGERGPTGNRIRVIDLKSGVTKLTFPVKVLGDLAFAPDGKRLAVASQFDRPIQIWNIQSQRLERTLRGHTGWLNSILFLSDGRLVSCSWDRTVRIWDPTNDQEVQRLPMKELTFVSRAEIHPAGDRFACSQAGASYGYLNLILGDPSSGIQIHELKKGGQSFSIVGERGIARQLAFSTDGTRLISGDDTGTTRVYDPSTRKQLQVKGPPPLPKNAPPINVPDVNGIEHSIETVAVALSPEGTLAGSSTRLMMHDLKNRTGRSAPQTGEARVWEVATGTPRFTVTGHTSTVTGLAFSPTGDRFATMSYGKIIVTEVETGKPVREIADKNIGGTHLAWTPDGGSLVFANNNGVQFWDAKEGTHRMTLAGRADNRFSALAFSPDGSRTVTAFGTTVRIWETASGRELLTLPILLPEQQGDYNGFQVMAIRFTPNGRQLLAILSDGTVQAWDAGAEFSPKKK